MSRKRDLSNEALDIASRRVLDRAERQRRPLGPIPDRKLVPCRRCTGQALCEVDDQDWVYHCLHCGETWSVEE